MAPHTFRSSGNNSHKPLRAGDKPEAQRVLVIGGTLFIGRHLVTELLHAGHHVHILHRKPGHPFGKRVHELIADRNDVESVRAAVGANRFDAVYDIAYDWERGTTCAQVEAVARLFDGKVYRYVFMSSVAAYGDGLNHHEGDALAPDDHANAYARNKAMTERALFRLHQRTGFPIVTLRPPFVYGPGNPFYREAFFWDRIRAGRRIILPSEGHRLMQFVYVFDLVEAALKLLEHRNVVGHAFNIANPRAITQHELILDLARVAGAKDPEMVAIPREWIHRMGGQVSGEKLYFGTYYDLPAITEIITKAQRMLAFKPTEFAAGLKTTHRAYLKDHTSEPSFAFDDELLTMFARHSHATRSA
ncbi:MAG: NAD-dependent epimerase/dehydratase family protein [Acidobacteriaceae bacterium]|nr:NAD-dependent epimerase/dehydratase family protein [Acidobacteriaceae bacterium]